MNKDLKLIFYGTPDFAVATLAAIVDSGRNVAAVVTAPDKPSGRGRKLNQSAVKTFADKKGIEVLQPSNLKSDEFQTDLERIKPDLQVIVAFRMLPEKVWNFPRLGTFNIHASLLPLYRGAAPINWAVMNGEKESGVTSFFLQHEIDTGDILLQEKINIGKDENAGALHDKLMQLGADISIKTLDGIENENLIPFKQDEALATKHAPKIFKEDCLIDWKQSNEQIRNKIRGLSPFPTAWTYFIDSNGNEVSFKIFEAEIEVPEPEEGEIEFTLGKIVQSKNRLAIDLNGAILNIKVLQPAGKKRMDVRSFINGLNDVSFTKVLIKE